MDNRFENALEELRRIPVSEESEVSKAVTAVRVELTEGRVDIARRQKRIKIADRSEYGWTTVELYEHDELASDSVDEKKLEKEVEKRVAKHKRDKMSKRARKNETSSLEQKKWPTDPPQQHSSRTSQLTMPPRAGMTRLIGPCYRFGEMGHLVATCQQTRLSNWYPFEGSVRWGISDGMWGYKVSEQEVGTKEGFPSNHRQQEVTNNLLMEMTDVQNNAVELWLEELHGLSDQDDLEPLSRLGRPREWGGSYWVVGPR